MQSNCFLEEVRTGGIKAAVASKQDAEKSLVEVDHADQELGNHFSIVLSGSTSSDRDLVRWDFIAISDQSVLSKAKSCRLWILSAPFLTRTTRSKLWGSGSRDLNEVLMSLFIRFLWTAVGICFLATIKPSLVFASLLNLANIRK